MCLIFIYHYNSLTSENFDPILQMAGEGKKQLNINNQAGVMQYSTCTDKLFCFPLVHECLWDHSLFPLSVSDVISTDSNIISAYKL